MKKKIKEKSIKILEAINFEMGHGFIRGKKRFPVDFTLLPVRIIRSEEKKTTTEN